MWSIGNYALQEKTVIDFVIMFFQSPIILAGFACILLYRFMGIAAYKMGAVSAEQLRFAEKKIQDFLDQKN